MAIIGGKTFTHEQAEAAKEWAAAERARAKPAPQKPKARKSKHQQKSCFEE